MSASSNKDKGKKPSKGIVVESRYKRSAETYSSQSSNSKDSTKGFAKDDLSMVKSGHSSKSTWRSNSSGKAFLSKKFTSTPALHGSSALPAIDQSAIGYASGSLLVPNNYPSANITSTSKKLVPKSKIKEQTIQPSSEQTFNIAYAQYLQAKLLESMALKSLEKRYKCALEKIHQVWHLLLVLLDKHKTVERRLNYITLITILHGHSQNQKEMISRVLDVIPGLEKQYSSIADTIATVNNKLEVENIVLPDEGLQSEVINLIDNISDLMNKIINSSPYGEKLISVSIQTESVVDQTNVLLTEVNRARELLQEASDLVLSETSLRLQST